MAINKKNIRKRLGHLSSKYETGGRGSVTVSSGKGDLGGVSYGSYQFTSRGGKNSNVANFIKTLPPEWQKEFKGKEVNSPEFKQTWKNLASQNKDKFYEYEHKYINKNLYEPQLKKIKKSRGIDISSRSKALQNVVWSTAVQHGGGTNVVTVAIDKLKAEGKELTDENLISAIYGERGREDEEGNVVRFKSSSKEVQKGVKSRYKNEEKQALALLKQEKQAKPGDKLPAIDLPDLGSSGSIFNAGGLLGGAAIGSMAVDSKSQDKKVKTVPAPQKQANIVDKIQKEYNLTDQELLELIDRIRQTNAKSIEVMNEIMLADAESDAEKESKDELEQGGEESSYEKKERQQKAIEDNVLRDKMMNNQDELEDLLSQLIDKIGQRDQTGEQQEEETGKFYQPFLDKAKSFGGKVKQGGGFILNMINSALNWVKSKLKWLLLLIPPILAWWNEATKHKNGIVGWVFEKILDLIKKGWDWLSSVDWAAVWEKIKTFFTEDVANWFKSVDWSEVFNRLLENTQKVGELLGKAVDWAYTQLFGSAWTDVVKPFFQRQFEKLVIWWGEVESAGGFWNWLKYQIYRLFNGSEIGEWMKEKMPEINKIESRVLNYKGKEEQRQYKKKDEERRKEVEETQIKKVQNWQAPVKGGNVIVGKSGVTVNIKEGSPVYAINDGTVLNVYTQNGNTVVMIRHNDGTISHYHYLSSVSVKRHQQVKKGDIIAKTGINPQTKEPQFKFFMGGVSQNVYKKLFITSKTEESKPTKETKKVSSQPKQSPTSYGKRDIKPVVSPKTTGGYFGGSKTHINVSKTNTKITNKDISNIKNQSYQTSSSSQKSVNNSNIDKSDISVFSKSSIENDINKNIDMSVFTENPIITELNQTNNKNIFNINSLEEYSEIQKRSMNIKSSSTNYLNPKDYSKKIVMLENTAEYILNKIDILGDMSLETGLLGAIEEL